MDGPVSPMHAYSVFRQDTDPTTGQSRVVLFNPHGHFEYLLFDELRENLGALTILE